MGSRKRSRGGSPVAALMILVQATRQKPACPLRPASNDLLGLQAVPALARAGVALR